MKKMSLFLLLALVALTYGATTNAFAGVSAGNNHSNQVLKTANLDSYIATPDIMGQATTTFEPVANIIDHRAPAPAGNAMFSEISNIFPGIYHGNRRLLFVSTAPAANGQVAFTSSTDGIYVIGGLTGNNAGNLNQIFSRATLGDGYFQANSNLSSGSTIMYSLGLQQGTTLVQSKHRSVTFTASNAGIPSAVGHAFISAATKSS